MNCFPLHPVLTHSHLMDITIPESANMTIECLSQGHSWPQIKTTNLGQNILAIYCLSL